jgi:DNA-binding CsgD family transcriptional regulator/PAS domain-containing protein
MNALTDFYEVQERRKRVTPSLNAFTDLSRLWQDQPYGEAPVDYTSFIHSFPAIELLLNRSPCITWILNVQTAQFDFISRNVKSILGYETTLWKAKGLAFLNEVIHPQDQPRIWKLFRCIWDLLLALPPNQRKYYQFTGDYRVRKPDGNYVRILEQNTILQQDNQGNITHLLITASNISHWKKSEALVASVTSTENGSCFCYTSDDDHLSPATQLSKREREIVKLLSEGCSSKCIADQLSISFHTVNKHRQNIIEKTQTRNVSEVVHFAFTNGLI